MSELGVTPPDSLLKYEAPLFMGIEPNGTAGVSRAHQTDGTSKIDDMINSMLPSRCEKLTSLLLLISIVLFDRRLNLHFLFS